MTAELQSPLPALPPLDLGVSLIACDAERTIEQTIRSVRPLAGRVIVVDSGSRDRTPEICAALGAEVVRHDWEGYGRQKQFALELCDTGWVLCLDADESVDDRLAASIRRALETDKADVEGYAMNRRLWLGDAELRHTWQPEWKVRLVRRGRARWVGEYHERLDVSAGRVERLEGILRHHAVRDVSELVRKQAMHGVQAAEVFHVEGARSSLPRLVFSPAGAVLKQLVLHSAWRDGWRGWVSAFGAGIYATAKHMRLLELSKRSTPSP